MPYIRLYSKNLSLREKRLIARQLLSITEQSFGLPGDGCRNTTIQFAPAQGSRPEYCAVVEVSGQRMEPSKMADFVSAVSPVLANRFGPSPLRRLFAFQRPRAKLVAVEFNQMAFCGGLESKDLSASGLNAAA
jgi:hypothetical protein